jgi:hypothetical protein
MTDAFPRWPDDWLEDHTLATEEAVAASAEVEFLSALRSDGSVLFSVTWPEGRRYMLVDPIGNVAPQALRVGERSEDAEVARSVEGVWSGALALAKQLIDGEVDPPAAEGADDASRRGRWRRGNG